MSEIVLVDAGPLVSLIDRKQTNHAWARETLKRFRDPLVTCDAVITEASHLLEDDELGRSALLDMLERGNVVSAFDIGPHIPRVIELMRRYHDVPMAFADACLVRMAELHTKVLVWTEDSDFRVYRRHGRRVIPTVMPAVDGPR